SRARTAAGVTVTGCASPYSQRTMPAAVSWRGMSDSRIARRLEAAHVQWHSQDGPDELANAIALCSLHHALFDCGVLGLSPGLRVTVSPLYVATSQSGRAIDALAGQPLLHVRPGQPSVDIVYVNWHTIQVFKSHGHRAA
ncbi:MAG: HNH endonuclease, partial [Actinobacteria bacterium]|nr:HNH endonuclease [Actinomycetota bacterium]